MKHGRSLVENSKCVALLARIDPWHALSHTHTTDVALSKNLLHCVPLKAVIDCKKAPTSSPHFIYIHIDLMLSQQLKS